MTTAVRPHLTAVPNLPAAPLEGVLVEKTAAVEKVQPSWLGAAKDHVVHHRGYLPWAARGYQRIATRWIDRYHDDWPVMIETVRAELREADAGKHSALKELKKQHRADYLRHRLIHVGATSAWTLAGGTGLAVGTATGGVWVDVAAALGAYLYGLRRGIGDEVPSVISSRAAFTLPPGQDAPSPDSIAPLDEEELRAALRAAGFAHAITVISSTPMATDGTRTVTFDLGGATTVTELQKKTESIAAALGRDVTMVDIGKVPGRAGRATLWTAESDPFERPRPSPLLSAEPSPIDSWRDGIPVAYGKRGNIIKLPLTNQNTLIGGMSRSGKGVGASNLIAGAAMDAMVNLRIVSGKYNGEWDAYARAGIASTYFKPSPERLLALLQGVLADKNRRERDLGKLGKSKLIHDLIKTLGGVEVIAIDEVATYTRPGKPLRDEILAALEELSSVALGAGILLILITQYPEVDVISQALAMNCGTKWAMRVDNATQSNAILGAGSAGAGRDASKFDPPRPGLGWLVNPFADVTDLARSFDIDEDERGEITALLGRAAEIRRAAGRLAGQWDDPIERYLLNATGLSSAAGGPDRDGVPGRAVHQLSQEQRHQLAVCREALKAMDQLKRDVAQLDEMASIIGAITGEEIGEALRAAGAGGTVKVTIDGRRVNGYKRADIADALNFLTGA